jgi:hypothetical protein
MLQKYISKIKNQKDIFLANIKNNKKTFPVKLFIAALIADFVDIFGPLGMISSFLFDLFVLRYLYKHIDKNFDNTNLREDLNQDNHSSKKNLTHKIYKFKNAYYFRIVAEIIPGLNFMPWTSIFVFSIWYNSIAENGSKIIEISNNQA